MSDKILDGDTVCIAFEKENEFTKKFVKQFSDLAIKPTVITAEVLETGSYKEINAVLSTASYLIILFDSQHIECDCITCAVQHFDGMGKENNIFPIFTGANRENPNAAESALVKRFGNRIIESNGLDTKELASAVYSRIRGFHKLQKIEKKTVDDTYTEQTFGVRNSTIKIMSGSILNSQCEVMVSSDDNLISHGGGVSLAIFQKGGDSIQQDAEKNLPANLGDVIVTSAGQLTQKLIFHAITLDLIGNSKQSAISLKERKDLQKYIISNTIRRSFFLLSSLQLTSIAFPVIGTGVAKIPFKKAITDMLSIFAEQLQKTAKSLLVELWIFNPREADVNSIAKKVLGRSEPEPETQQPLPAVSGQDIFISYSRQDIDKAKEITEFLSGKRLQYWIDMNGVYSGQRYKSIIVQAIRQSKIVIFLSSVNSNKSENVIKEIALAVAMGKQIIPIKIDSAQYSDEIAYDLCPVDFIDLEKDATPFQKIYYSILSKINYIDTNEKGFNNDNGR